MSIGNWLFRMQFLITYLLYNSFPYVIKYLSSIFV